MLALPINRQERFMNSRLTYKTIDNDTSPINIRPGTAEMLIPAFLGGATDDGLGDIYPEDVPNTFIPKLDYKDKPGTEDSWSTYHIPNIYRTDGDWNRHLPIEKKIQLRKVLNYLFQSGKYITKIKASGGSFGSGNLYTSERKGPYFHAGVIPVENPVTIPDSHEYGIPRHSHPNSRNYDSTIYFSFVKNAFIICDMEEDMLNDMIECYNNYLCHSAYSAYTNARELGQLLKILHQGGFKYMLHHTYDNGNVFIVESLQHCTMKVGAKPYNKPNQKPITTGGGLHLPVCIVDRTLFDEVTIPAIKNFGTHFEMYGMIKPGEIYMLNRMRDSKHYWTFPAPHGAFIYRPKNGKDCKDLGCVVLPFGISKLEQTTLQASCSVNILTRCILCLEDGTATYGFNCYGHKHRLLCKTCATSANLRKLMVGQKYKCSICRKLHDVKPSEC